MRRTIYILAAVLTAASMIFNISCSREENPEYQNNIIRTHGREYDASCFEPDLIRVKLNSALADSLQTDDDGVVNLESSGVKSVDDLVASLGVTMMRRTFPPAGEFEQRTREAGLHLWYNVYFDENAGLTRAGGEMDKIEGFDMVEYCPKTVRIGSTEAVVAAPSQPSDISRSAMTDIFNDPGLKDQWHYYNDGSRQNSVAGSDINVIPVWQKKQTGKPEVIVAVVDGGVDYAHEDLAANMWHNPEQSGDLVYGWNFVGSGGPRITPDDHGTHVAGTIAAVNNNGKGVCGIAGGDGSSDSGVRIMSCQIFQGEDGGSGAEAIKWAADHGAVIAQNSWGYSFKTYQEAQAGYTPQADKDAIDYFIANAGKDKNGVQTGPMSGGIVIFAAGNDGWDIGYPGEYEKCLAVASIGADYREAYYTNYGSWVDVCAPGGDVKKGNQVYSTLPGNQYGYMQGTSMACPHVSGVAALIVSEKGGKGYTPTALRKTIEDNVLDISANSGSRYLGKGLVNAYRSVFGSTGDRPDRIKDFKASVNSNNISFSLVIPADKDNGKPNMIYVYYSESQLTSSNLESAKFSSYAVGDMEPGDVLTDVLTVDKFSTKYYLAAVATDYGGNTSPMSTVLTITTGENHAPELVALDGTHLDLRAWQTGELRFHVSEQDGHPITATATTEGDTVSLSTVLRGDTLSLYIQGRTSRTGAHTAMLRVEDPYKLYDEVEVTYTVAENVAPVLIKEVDGVAFNSTQDPTITLDMNEYFSDADGEPLSLTAVTTVNGIANLAVRQNRVNITPLTYGTTTATITGTDVMGETVSTTFNIVVRDASQPIDIYPNPVVDTLYIRAGSDSQGHVRITSASGSTVFDDDISVSIFDPAAIDMSALPGGMYVLTVEYEGNVIKRSIAKL